MVVDPILNKWLMFHFEVVPSFKDSVDRNFEMPFKNFIFHGRPSPATSSDFYFSMCMFLWLKAWPADPACKRCLTQLLYQGRHLFDAYLHVPIYHHIRVFYTLQWYTAIFSLLHCSLAYPMFPECSQRS